MAIRWCSSTQNTGINNDGGAMWNDELRWQFDVVPRRKIQGWTTMASFRRRGSMRRVGGEEEVVTTAGMDSDVCQRSYDKWWNDEVNCETTEKDEMKWIERGLQRRGFSSFDCGRTDVPFFTPCVFEIWNFVYEFITSKVSDFLRFYIFVRYSTKIILKI
jgi:hypothetical protein